MKKFDSKSIKDIFLRYSTSSKKYEVYNLKIPYVEENMHVICDEFNDFDDKRKENND